jgi:hypothetical protein
MDGRCGTAGEKRNVYRVLMRKPEETRLFGRPGRRREDNVKVENTGSEGIDRMRMSREWKKVARFCEQGNEPSGSINAGNS